MPRTCTICSHPERGDIESAIVAQVSYRDIARQWHTSKDAVARHAAEHISQAISRAQEAKEAAQALDVVKEMEWCNQAAHTLYDGALAETQPDRRTALSALAEVRKQTELWAELQGELDRSTHIDLRLDPQWLSMRELIFRALEPFPQAKRAVAQALYEEAQRGERIA